MFTYILAWLLGNLVWVKTYWEDGLESKHLLPAGHLEQFVDATLELHYRPGINPITKKKTLPVIRIAAIPAPFFNSGPMTTPGLRKKWLKGAITYAHNLEQIGFAEKVLWERPE